MATARIRYRCLGRTVEDETPERTILDISIANKIPHWRECGGHGRCTTCRVRVLDGITKLSPRTQRERALAEARGWDPSLRLACQTRVAGEVTVERLVTNGADSSQVHAETLDPLGRHVEAAILACGLRDFSHFVESHQPAEVVEILNRVSASIAEPIILNGGLVDTCTGGEVVGLFVAEDKSAEQACRASVRAARGASSKLRALDRELEGELGVHLRVGISVHFGPVVLGRIGPPWRLQFTAVGHTVDVARRLQVKAGRRGKRMLVSKSVIEQLPPGGLEIAKEVSTRAADRSSAMRVHVVDGFVERDHALVVQRTVDRVLDESGAFTRKLYARLFAAEPELADLFVHGIEAQTQMLEHALRSAVFALERPEQLALGLRALGARHVGYGVEARHYELFRMAMVNTIAELFDDEHVVEAWADMVDRILALMREHEGVARDD